MNDRGDLLWEAGIGLDQLLEWTMDESVSEKSISNEAPSLPHLGLALNCGMERGTDRRYSQELLHLQNRRDAAKAPTEAHALCTKV